MSINEIIDIRKTKKALYIALLNKGLKNLTDTEKNILEHLSQDEDIHLLLKNGHAFEIEKNNK